MMNVWHGLRLFQTAGIIAQLWESLRRFLSFISVWLLSCIFFVSCNIKFVNLCFFFKLDFGQNVMYLSMKNYVNNVMYQSTLNSNQSLHNI